MAFLVCDSSENQRQGDVGVKYECFKLFVKRRAWLLFLIFLVIRIFTAFLQQNYLRDIQMDVHFDAYMQSMEVLEGKLTPEKSAYIAEQNALIDEMLSLNREAVYNDYISGAITDDEYDTCMMRIQQGKEMQEAFAVINERYAQVSENPERIYFLYTNGWVGLLGNERLDYVLLIMLMLMIVPTICSEFSTDMYPILRSTPNGGIRLYAAKCGVGILTALLAAVLCFAVELGYYAAVFRLPDGSFPLQSLPPFVQSPYEVSIIGAAALTLVNRCFGAMYFSVLLICFAVLCRRALSAIFLGTLTILFPYLLWSESTMKYLFPTPLGFFLSCGFLKGSFLPTPLAEQSITISPMQYGVTFAASVCIMLLLFCIGMYAYIGKRMIHIRCKAFVYVLLVFPVFLTGCSHQPKQPDFDGFVFDSNRYQPVTTSFSLVRDDVKGLCIAYKDSSELIPIIRDCFSETDSYRLGCLQYIDGDTVYYLNQYSMFHYAVIALDPHDFSERVVHEIEWSDNIDKMDMLFGLGLYLPAKAAQDESVSSFFVHENQLILQKSNHIDWYDLQSDWHMRFYDGQARNLVCTCGAVYYLDELMDVYRFDLQSRTTEKMSIGKAEYFYASDDGLYYKDLREGAFYHVSADGSAKTLSPAFDESKFQKEAAR